MRVTVGIFGIVLLGATVAVATAQAPASGSVNQRRARLLPPETLHPAELQIVARTAPDDVPTNPTMTPVVRPASRASANSPGWLNGTDPNVRPASGTGTPGSQVRPLTSRTDGTKDESSLVSKGLDKLKNAFGGNDRPESAERGQLNQPPGIAKVSASANTAFRGTGANGAPVYAGPPAYRWYGWGSVTPGANPYAPNGQHPPASANWFSITGATPGAFPVPVMNPMRAAPGTEPPAYTVMPNGRIAPISNTVGLPTRTTIQPSDAMGFVPPPVDLSRADSPGESRVTPMPTITPPPAIVVPTISQPTDREPPIRPLTGVTPLPQLPEIKPVEPAISVPKTTPAALPVSVTDDPMSWQPNSESTSPDGWGPSKAKPQSSTTQPAPDLQQPGMGRSVPGLPVARGQVGDTQPDPMVAVIKRVCEGRVIRVDVRWTGSKKLEVVLQCRNAAEAHRLVKDISAQPQLAPVQIDFSIVVK